MQFDQNDFNRMLAIERALVQTLLPFRDGKTESGLAAFALVRCARVLLRRYPPETQKQLLGVITAFLEGKTSPPGEPSELMRWLQ